MQVLVVNTPGHALPEGTTDLLGDIGWSWRAAPDYHEAIMVAKTGQVDVVILSGPSTGLSAAAGYTEFQSFLRLIDAQRIATVMLTDTPRAFRLDPNSLVDVVNRDISLAEFRGRLAMIERYHGLLKRLEQEVHNMERLSKRLNHHFLEIDQELRLAGRLQHDFLPNLRDPIGNLQFATVYRPASWVSGDMFDVFRIDQDHTGVYLADAVGHGLAASLLTMFIKRAIVPKQIREDSYTVVGPAEVMRTLNDALADQALPNCQFVTACYALFDHRRMTLQYARGGHPYPILITGEGISTELKTPGGLLGLSKGEEFPVHTTELQPGDRILMYTDGIELCCQPGGEASKDARAHFRLFDSVAGLSVRPMMKQINDRLDEEAGSLHPKDDITIVGFEVLKADTEPSVYNV